MSGILDGMTVKEAEALVRALHGVSLAYSGPNPCNGRDALDTIKALAALGAKVVGCKEVRETRWVCVRCGPGVAADEDGCCSTCGRDCQVTDGRVIVLEADHE